MKTRLISSQHAAYLLQHRLETPLQQIIESSRGTRNKTYPLLLYAKMYLNIMGNEILLNSGAKLCFNSSLVGQLEGNTPLGSVYKSGWFISGYSASGVDVDCYFNKKLYYLMVKEKCILVRNEMLGLIPVRCCYECH